MRILPYIEQNAAYAIYQNLGGADPQPRYSHANNRPVVAMRIPILTCPSDTPNAPLGATATLPAITNHNYAVNYGNTSFFQMTLQGVPFLGAPFYAYTNSPGDDGPVNAAQVNNFPRVYGKSAGIGEITDGTSNTLMMTEVLQGRNSDLRGFTWWGGASGIVTFMPPNSTEPDVLVGGICVPLTSPRMPCTTTGTTTRPRMMGARGIHAGGGVMVNYCDGHVSFVINGIDYNTWQAQGSAQGGEVVTVE